MNGLRSYKFCLLGDQGVGKTSIKQSFFGIPFHSHYLMTMGVDFTLKEVEVKGEEFQLQLWDVSGHPSVRNIRERYIQDADGIILVFDLTREETFQNIPAWIKEIIINCSKSVVLQIIGNKADLEEHLPFVQKDEIDSLIDHLHEAVIAKHFHNIGYFICSAKTKLNIDEVFLSLILAIGNSFELKTLE
ncbi:MAG: Rab family GTPase [Promethearchaeota archaeon]